MKANYCDIFFIVRYFFVDIYLFIAMYNVLFTNAIKHSYGAYNQTDKVKKIKNRKTTEIKAHRSIGLTRRREPIQHFSCHFSSFFFSLLLLFLSSKNKNKRFINTQITDKIESKQRDAEFVSFSLKSIEFNLTEHEMIFSSFS